MSTGTTRVDVELVSRGLVRSRRRAADLVAAGRVRVAGSTVRKPSQPVAPGDPIDVVADGPEFVSRAAHKLDGALTALAGVPSSPVVTGARCLDVGASTGGFTQVLLARGAEHVVAVDVGHGQMAPEVAADPRVTLIEGVNARTLAATDLPGAPPSLVVADLSFISLTMVIEPVLRVTAPGGQLLVLVKPQFEVGRQRLGNDGVVTAPALRAEAVDGVARHAVTAGGQVRAVLPSGLAGESGNREYFLWITAGPVPPLPQGADPTRYDEPGPSPVDDVRGQVLAEAARRAVAEDRVVLLEEVA